MSVATDTSKIQYTVSITGTPPALSFPYPFYDETDLVVIFVDGTTGAETTLTLTTDYTVTPIYGGYENGGVVTMVTDTYAGEITIARIIPLLQETDYQDYSNFPADVFEDNLDKLTMMIQQLNEKFNRQLTAPISDPSTIDMTIPTKADRANTFLAFDADGDPIPAAGMASVPVSTFMETVLDDADDTAARNTLFVGIEKYDATKSYAVNWLVTYQGNIYKCIQAGIGQTPAVGSSYWTLYPTEVAYFDLIIDSNAKLDLLCQAIAGQYKKVYIKAGTWTASALSPTAGVLINLTSTGTTYIFAEKGSKIVYSGAYSGDMIGIYRSTAYTDMSLERHENITIEITNTTATRSAYGFKNVSNLNNCKATATASTTGIAAGYWYCKNLINCVAGGIGGTGGDAIGFLQSTELVNCIGTGTGGGAGNGYGIYNCDYILNSHGIGVGGSTGNGVGIEGGGKIHGCWGEGTGNGGGYGRGISNASHVSDCVGDGTGQGAGAGTGFYNIFAISNSSGTGIAGSTGIGRGFDICTRVTGCIANASGGSTSGAAYGFATCVQVIGCRGKGVASGSGVGYGFFACNKCQQNMQNGASKTATYNTSYADAGTANACADTAAGGYNS